MLDYTAIIKAFKGIPLLYKDLSFQSKEINDKFRVTIKEAY